MFLSEPNQHEGMNALDVLRTHVFDMDVGLMRSVIAQVAGPPDCISSNYLFLHVLFFFIQLSFNQSI